MLDTSGHPIFGDGFLLDSAPRAIAATSIISPGEWSEYATGHLKSCLRVGNIFKFACPNVLGILQDSYE